MLGGALHMYRIMIPVIAIGCFPLGMTSGCSSYKSRPVSAYSQADHAPFETVQAQITYGTAVYAKNYSDCHGGSGQGTNRAPALVGPSALGDFRTAMDVAVLVTENMPPQRTNPPESVKRYFWNSLSTERPELASRDFWAVLAFALVANEVALDEPVGPHNADGIVLNP